MENKYLVKVCALLRAPMGQKKSEKPKPAKATYKTHPAGKPKVNKYSAKIKKQKQRQGK